MAIDKAPLNIRNNNPGNLRFVGQEGASQGEGGFAKFDTPAAGMEAMRRQIELDTQKRGLNLTQFLNKYAPPSENKTTNYIDFVAKKTGLDPNAPVPPDLIPKLQTAMIEMEGGPKSLSYFQQTSTQVAKAPTPKAGPRTTVQAPVATAAAIDPKELPSNYTAALALNYLADTDPQGEVMAKVNEMMAEMQESSAPKRPAGGQILMQYAQGKTEDPFAIMAKAQEPEPQQQQQQGRRVVPKMPKMFADGGEVTWDVNLSDDEMRKKSQEMLYNLRVNMGPVTGQFVPAPNGVDVRTSTQLGAIRPFVDISPNEAAVSQVGATYGNMTPQGGYEVGVSQRMPIDTPSGKIRMPVTVQGGMNAPIGKNANVGVQGFYVPRQEGMPQPAYGANLTYQRRFADGGLVAKAANLQQATLKPADREWIAARQKEFEGYNKQVEAYNAALADYQKQVDAYNESIKPYQAEYDAYLAEVEKFNKQADDYNALIASYAIDPSGRLVTVRGPTQFGDYYQVVQPNRQNIQADQAINYNPANIDPSYFIEGYSGQTRWRKDIPNVQYVDQGGGYGYLKLTGQGSVANDRPYSSFTQRTAPTLTAKPPGNPPPDFTMAEPTAPTNTKYTIEEFNKYQQEAAARAQKAAQQRAIALQVMSGQGVYGNLGLSLTPNQSQQAQLFAKGGVVSNEVPQVDAQGRVVREAPTPEPQYSVGERIVGAGETALSALSGLTAPASIAYDVLRGRPQGEISPGNFMYTPRTPAGQTMSQDLGRFMQEYKLDAAMPQVQLQRPYPIIPAAKQGITALRRGAEELQLPLAVDTPPTGALMPKQRVDTSVLLPQENKPFIGEVERIVADLPGPVTKQQFLNFMKKQGRAYEIGRVERALENFDDNDKIQPTELMDRLKYTSPSRFTTEIIPPGSKYIYDMMDNPFPSTKPGAVNLLLDLPESDQALATLKERADMVLNNMSPYKFLSATNRSRVYTDGEANLGTRPSEYVKEMTPIIRELAEATGKDPEKSLERLTRLGDRAEFLTTLGTSRARIAFPALTSDWKKYTTMPEKDLPAGLKSDFGTLDINKLLVKLYEDGADNLIKLADQAPEGFKVDTREVQILKRYIDLYRQGKASLNEVQEYAKFADVDIGAQHTTEIKALGSLLDRVATDVQRMAEEVPVTFYEGTHRAITAKNPISFSRFVEFTPQQEVDLGISAPTQTRGAIMFLELQSDRQKALRLNKEVEEAFPGMGNLPQVTQQLMIKNAIYGGIKMNKGLVLFPGSDSAQAQLYEKLGPNLKQVVKDLGPGFKAQEFKFPNEKGEMATRWGVYIDEDAAKRIQTQGIRFAKGGMVDKPLYDRAA